jgi:hypothetical protein
VITVVPKSQTYVTNRFSGAQNRWAKGMMQYFGALRDAVVFEPSAHIEDTIERYVRYRYYSIAVTPMFAFIE